MNLSGCRAAFGAQSTGYSLSVWQKGIEDQTARIYGKVDITSDIDSGTEADNTNAEYDFGFTNFRDECKLSRMRVRQVKQLFRSCLLHVWL